MKNQTLKASFSQTFLVGLLALLPLALTVTAIVWSASLLEQFVGPDSTVGGVLTEMGLSVVDSRYIAYGLGVVLVAIGIYLLGALLQRGLARPIQELVNNLLRRIPVVGKIYDLADRFIAAFGAKDDPALKSMVPAWCFFGGDGGTAVLALLPNAEPIEIDGFEYFAIIIPSAPVPFGGALLYVPKDWVKPAGMGVEGLTSVYVTMGASAPTILKEGSTATPPSQPV